MNIIFKKLFLSLSEKKFYFFAPIVLFITDIALIFYISKYMLPKLINHQFISMILKAQQLGSAPIRVQDSKMFQDMILSSMSLAFSLILIFNLLIYLMAMKKMKWPLKYVHGYCLSAALLSIIEIASYIYNGSGLNIVTIMTMISYYTIYEGYNFFKKSEE